MSLGDYLELLDWTGRQLAQGNKGRIPLFGAGRLTPPEPILQRLQLDQNGWCARAARFGPTGRLENLPHGTAQAGE